MHLLLLSLHLLVVGKGADDAEELLLAPKHSPVRSIFAPVPLVGCCIPIGAPSCAHFFLSASARHRVHILILVPHFGKISGAFVCGDTANRYGQRCNDVVEASLCRGIMKFVALLFSRRRPPLVPEGPRRADAPLIARGLHQANKDVFQQWVSFQTNLSKPSRGFGLWNPSGYARATSRAR